MRRNAKKLILLQIICLTLVLNIQLSRGEGKTQIYLHNFENTIQPIEFVNLHTEIPEIFARVLAPLQQFSIHRTNTTGKQSTKRLETVEPAGQTETGDQSSPSVVLSGTCQINENYILVVTRLHSQKEGNLIAQYESQVSRENFDQDLALEIENLADKIVKDLTDKKTPFGYPFHQTELGILVCDIFFKAGLKGIAHYSPRFWQELNDSLRIYFPAEKYGRLKIKHLSRARMENYLVPTLNANSHQTALQIGKELNARLVIWGESLSRSGTNPRIQFHFTNTRTGFMPPPIQPARLPAFSPVRELECTDLPLLDWSERALAIQFLKAYLLNHFHRFDEALTWWQHLENKPAAAKSGQSFEALYFYFGNTCLLQGQRSTANWEAAMRHWRRAMHYFRKNLALIEPAPEFVLQTGSVFNNLGLLYQFWNQPDSAIIWLNKALKTGREYQLNQLKLRVNHNLANVFLLRREWNKALPLYQASLDIFQTTENRPAQAIMHDNLGILFQRLNRTKAAIENFQKSVDLKQEQDDPLALAQSYYYLGNAYRDHDKMDAALESYLKSLDINLKLRNKIQIAKVYNQIGRVHRLRGNYVMALEYYLKRAQLMEYLGEAGQLMETYLIIADIYQQKFDFPPAINFLDKAEMIARQQNDQSTLAQILDKKGDVYNTQQKYDHAIETYQQATEILTATKQNERLALTLFNMSLLHLKQQNYLEGYNLMKRALAIDEAGGYLNLKKEKQFLQELSFLIDELNQ